jgi:hypothetical protein
VADTISRCRINEYIPRLREEGRFLSKGQDQAAMRAALRDEALSCFSVQAEYSERLRLWRLQRSVEEVKGLVKALIPTDLENQYRACVMSALQKIMLEDDRSFGIGPPANLKGPDGVYDAPAVRDFITENWKQLGDVAWELLRQKNGQHMKAKAPRRKAAEEAQVAL